MVEHSFQEVMGQWQRFCKSHADCGECEFAGKCICGKCPLTNVPLEKIEKIIMQWAEIHPEVYPTWDEWLPRLGAVTHKAKPEVASELLEIGLLEHIPAVTAKKFGIQPKE